MDESEWDESAVDESALDESTLDESALDESTLDESALDESAMDESLSKLITRDVCARQLRECLTATKTYQQPQQLTTLRGYIECEKPNTDLYEFVGVMYLLTTEKNALGHDESGLKK